jgi:hypothetical protein
MEQLAPNQSLALDVGNLTGARSLLLRHTGLASPAGGFRVVAMDFTRFRCRHCGSGEGYHSRS